MKTKPNVQSFKICIVSRMAPVYGSKSYISDHPSAMTKRRYEDCDWVGFDDDHARFFGQQWQREKLSKRKPIIRSNNGVVLLDEVLKGMGIGVLPCFIGDQESGLK